MSASVKRQPGRPAVVAVDGAPGERLFAWVQQDTYDQACQLATRRGMSVSALVRDAVERLIRDESAAGVSSQ